MNILELKNVSKSYIKDKQKIEILKNVNYTFETGKLYAIMGHSGIGKTTLLNCISFLTNIDSGTIYINNKDTKGLSENQYSELRQNCIGIIFQVFYLNKYLNVFENVSLPLYLNKGISKEEIKQKVEKLLKSVNLNERKNHYPKELSGGECQRVAIARSLANNPNIILADEPTGNLDEETEELILNILKNLSQEGHCVIMATHSNKAAQKADIILKIKDRKLASEL